MRDRILIVEPEPSVRESLRLILRDDHEIETAGEMDEAKEMLSKGRFDLVMVDLTEGDLAPLTDLMSRVEGIPVIVISSFRDPSLIVNAMKLGVADYILKPFDVHSLRDSVEKAIRKSRETRAAMSAEEEREVIVDAVLFRGYFYYLESIRSFGRSVNTAPDMESLVRRMIQSVMTSLGVGQCMIFLPEDDGFALKSYSPMSQSVQNILTVPRSHPLFQFLEKEGRIAFERELKAHMPEDSRELISRLSGLGVYLYAPMLVEEKLMGAIVVGDKLCGTRFVPGELDLLSTLALQGAWAIRAITSRQSVEGMNRFLKDLLDNLTSGVIAIDVEGRILIFNSYAQKLTGYDPDQILGQNISKLGDEFSSMVMRSLGMDEPQKRVEVRLTSAKGDEIPIGMNISILKNPSGEKIGAAMIFADLSHVQRIEAKRRLSDKLDIWLAVAAELEHLFRNPLVSIKTFAQLLPEKYEDEEFRTKFYRLVGDDVDFMSSLIEEFTAFSHPLHLERKPADLNLIISKVISKLKGEMEGIELDLEYDEKLGQVILDSDLFSKALENVLTNCLDDLDPDRRRISLKTGSIQDIWNGGKKAIVEISYPRVEDYVRPLKGAGTIQFAIAERIIAEHGGLIYMEEKEGKMISLRIELPMEDESGSKA
ncbi:response regulator [Candidatus Poribacteria bacterium]|nr:response regulator [Candidatus Poribacteria bacterium]